MKKMLKRISAVILAFVLTTGVIPVPVLADTEVVNTENGDIDTTTSLEVDGEYYITITEDGAKEVWYQFTPAESGYYTVHSIGEYDSYCELYDSNKSELERNDDDGENSNFYLCFEMTAGTTYYYKFRMYSETVYGSYKVKLIKNVPATSITLDYDSYVDYVGTEFYLTAEFGPENAVHDDITWTTSDASVASVDDYGWVCFITPGEAVITATTESGLSATCKVTAKAALDATVNTTYNINTDGEKNRGVMYKFVPEESGYYRFYSFNGDCNTEAYLYDVNFKELDYNDNNGEGSHFAIDYELKAGEIYYIKVLPYYDYEMISFDFAIKEINPTKLTDVYFTVDNVKQEDFGFSVTEANEVTLWFDFSDGDDLVISEITGCEILIDKDLNKEALNFTAEFDSEKNLYYTKIPASYFTDGGEYYIDNVIIQNNEGDSKHFYDYNGTSIDTVYYSMGENTSVKSYKVYFTVFDETSEISVTTPRVTSLAEMGIEVPEVPVIEGAEFIGWELVVDSFCAGIIKSSDQKFSISDIFEQGNEEADIWLTAQYDKNIICVCFRYQDKDGNSAQKTVYGSVEKNITCAEWLETFLAGNQLNDIEHTTEMDFLGWSLGDYAEDVIDSYYTIAYATAQYGIDGVILGGVHIKEGDYLNNAGEVSKLKPEDGFAYYSAGKLILHNYSYKGSGTGLENKSYALYAGGDLEIVLEGYNSLHSTEGDVIHNEIGNLTISGDGYLDAKTYVSSDGIDLVDGDLTIKSGVLNVESGDHGFEIDGAITIDGGIIKIKAGDDGMDFDDDFIMNDGVLDIDTEDIGLDSIENIYVKGGFIRIKTEDNEGLEAGDNVVIDGGNIVIDANGTGIYSYGNVEINGGYTQIKSGEYAIMADTQIAFSDNMDEYEIIQLAESMIGIGINGEAVKEAVLKDADVNLLNMLDDSWVSVSEEQIAYTGEEIQPEISVNDGEKALVEGTDYTVSYYPNEINGVGEYLIIISGAGSYLGVLLKNISVYEDVINIGNTIMKNGEYLAVGSTEITDEKPEETGYAYYNNGVLELNNFTYEGSGYVYDTEGNNSIIYTENGIEIQLTGKNELINNDSSGEGITVYGLLTINGSGSINIEGIYGIGNYNSDIVIEDCNINITATDDAIWGYGDVTVSGGIMNLSAGHYCIYAEDNLNINGGSFSMTDAENGEVDDEYGYGLYCYNGILTIGDDAELKIDTECGIYAFNGDVILEDGKLDIAGEYGIWCAYGYVVINDTILNIDAVFGLFAHEDILFNNGIVNVKGSEEAVGVYYGNIEFSEGIGIIKPKNAQIGVVEDYSYILDSEGNISKNVTVMGDIAPVIYGAEDDKTYYRPVNIEIYDNNPVSVTINGEPVEDMSAPIVLDNSVPETYVIEAIDASGNVVEITVNVKTVSDISNPIFNISESNVLPEDKDTLEAVKAELEQALEEYGNILTDEEMREIKYDIRRVDNLLKVLDGEYATVYFDNSETNWECVFVYYEDVNGELNIAGQILPDENGIYSIKVPVDSRIMFCNYLPGQPPEEAPVGGFLSTDFMNVVNGKTYYYGSAQSDVLLGDTNLDTKINAQDALMVLKHSAKIQKLEGDPLTAADVTFDGNVNASDALEILKYAANIIDSFEKK